MQSRVKTRERDVESAPLMCLACLLPRTGLIALQIRGTKLLGLGWRARSGRDGEARVQLARWRGCFVRHSMIHVTTERYEGYIYRVIIMSIYATFAHSAPVIIAAFLIKQPNSCTIVEAKLCRPHESKQYCPLSTSLSRSLLARWLIRRILERHGIHTVAFVLKET